jgi:hypothetical protein
VTRSTVKFCASRQGSQDVSRFHTWLFLPIATALATAIKKTLALFPDLIIGHSNVIRWRW